MSRKIYLYISMSLDGYVATKDDNLDFLNPMMVEGEDYGHTAFSSQIDTYMVGRKTYQVVTNLLNGGFPQSEQYKKVYVITRQPIPNKGNITFYNGDLKQLVAKLKSQQSERHIYCDGGPTLVKALLELEAIDEFIISIIPVILGDGKRLFLEGLPKLELKLVESQHFDTGLVQLGVVYQPFHSYFCMISEWMP